MRRVGVVLAAGGSARFGSQKLLSDLAGRPLVWHAAETLRSAGLSVYVVVNDRRVASAAGAVDGVIYNPWWREGLSTSVKAAVVALHDADCIVWMLGDMPCVKPETVARLASTCGKGLVVPVYRGRRGNPVASGRGVFSAALGISGDVGLRALLGLVPVSYIEVDDEGVLFDVDTPEDLQKASSCVRRSSRV